ncbi:MAG: cytidylate kinase family protein [Thermofilaceae archaeon]
MEHVVVLIPGMLGAGCTSVAQELAKRTGLRIINSEYIIRGIVSEKRVSFTELANMARDGEIDLEDLVRSIAVDHVREGGVIVEGRTALMVLNQPVTLKVFLYADKRARIERIAKRRNISAEDAREEIEHSDADRNRLTERFYKKPYTDPTLYDIMLDTTNLAFSDAATIIESILKQRIPFKR